MEINIEDIKHEVLMIYSEVKEISAKLETLKKEIEKADELL